MTIPLLSTCIHWDNNPRFEMQHRAEYGKQVLQNLSNELTTNYGNGFGGRNLAKMIKFYELFSENILLTVDKIEFYPMQKKKEVA